MTDDRKKLAIYTQEEKLFVVDYPNSIDVNKEQEEMTLKSKENVKEIKDVLAMKIYSNNYSVHDRIYTGTSQGEINVYTCDTLSQEADGNPTTYKIKANDYGKVNKIAIGDDYIFCSLDKTKFFRCDKKSDDEEDLVLMKQFDREIISINCWITDKNERVFVNTGEKVIVYNQEGF